MDQETNMLKINKPVLVRQYNSPSNIDSAIKILKLYLKDLKKIKYNFYKDEGKDKISWINLYGDESVFKLKKKLKKIFINKFTLKKQVKSN